MLPIADIPIELRKVYLAVSKNRGPQNRPQYTMILVIRTPKEGPLIFGNPHLIVWLGDGAKPIAVEFLRVCLGSLQPLPLERSRDPVSKAGGSSVDEGGRALTSR